MSDRRLIEAAFPLEQASVDSVHEKNVRHGHISTLHIWPARRPLAACRAALIATLLPDPGTNEGRDELCKRIGGTVVKVIRKKRGPGAGKKEERIVKETLGGVLHWGRETENRADLDIFREEIRKACGGHAPRVLDPFAGGGAIPLEAMRLGCEVTAVDINPVAWLILKCTLEYPQRLAGEKRPLPEFVRSDRALMESFFKAQGFKRTALRSQLRKLGLEGEPTQEATLKDTQTGKDVDLQIEEHTLEADLAWHVRAWGWWVLREARRELAQRYPVYADFEPPDDAQRWCEEHPDRRQPMRLVPFNEDGTPNVESLNRDFSAEYLADAKNPRWVAKPAVAYLWARTVRCKNCRATIPLVKTLWLVKKPSKRVLLTITPNAERTGVVFGTEPNVPAAGGNNAQKREHDRRIGQGTMSRSGAWCPCCGKPGTVAMERDDIRVEGVNCRLGRAMTAVITEGSSGKEYRLPTSLELETAADAGSALNTVFEKIPFGLPRERISPGGSRTTGGASVTVHQYGMTTWADLFTERQLLATGVTISTIRRALNEAPLSSYPAAWQEALGGYLYAALSRLLDRNSQLCTWQVNAEKVGHTFARFALPITWDWVEVMPWADSSGGFLQGVEWVARTVEHLSSGERDSPAPQVVCRSAIANHLEGYDVVLTDPPYYDAIQYSDLMDYFLVWLRRTLWNLSSEIDAAFSQSLGPKWSSERDDGELIDEPSRHDFDAAKSKAVYERGMTRAFEQCNHALAPEGRLVIVFANKQPDAWESLVSALIQAGFCVDASWPIQTERQARMRSLASAALASSVWLVCRKRPPVARAGWDATVLQEMRANIGARLREFWDAGIRGPDFVWAATGPALEVYSKHPIVKKANQPNELMTVSEFLQSVRRLVVEFVVGRVLGEVTHTPAAAIDESAMALDDVTTYYLLHRHDFGMEDAPAGACILYALSCNLSEGDLADRYDILVRTGGTEQEEEEEEPDGENGDADTEEAVEEGSGSTFRLKSWKQRRRPSLGTDSLAENARARRISEETIAPRPLEETTLAVPRQRLVPLIDVVHRLMHLWVDGNVNAVNEYIDLRGLRRSEPFRQVLQAVIELAPEGSDERSVAERVMNHLRARGDAPAPDLLARIES
jgi:adenine-specific DNA methylase